MARTNLSPSSRQNYLIPDSLTQNAGTISAVIFGANYSVSIGTPAVNALTHLYWSGSALINSTLVPSTYRIANPTHILVGAWYATSHSPTVFGSFVNIEGTPMTKTEVSEGNSTTLVAAFTGITGVSLGYTWTRIGRSLFVQWRADNCTGNAATAGIPLPRNITMVEVNSQVGTYAGQNAGGNASGGSAISTGSTTMAFAGPNLTGAAISTQVGTGVVGTPTTTLTGTWRCSINEWSSTPLKDA